MCEAKSSTCPYCGDALTGQQRKKCGKAECKRAFNRDRAKEFTARHPGYYSKYDTVGCYGHICLVCGRAFKNHKDKPGHCSVECWRAGQAERQAEKQRQKRLPILHPGPYSMLPLRHPAVAMQRTEYKRLFIGGTCARCGEAFMAWAETGKASYCSRSCSSLAEKARRRAKKRCVETQGYMRMDIFERDHWRCHICGKRIVKTLGHSHPLGATVDHIIPIALGGADAAWNLAAAHRRCNGRKGIGGGGQLRLIG